MGPAEFLAFLWGPKPPGLIQTWQLETKQSGYWHAAHGTLTLAGRTDIYTAVSLAHKDHGRARRARADQAIAISGLWLDIDVNGGPDNKTAAAPDVDTATALANCITRPTLLVDSGYGLHAWYVFDEPWQFTNREEQDAGALASAQWYALHRKAAQTLGFGLDHAHDLARLMRLPGTINGKGGHRQPVKIVAINGPRYPREHLLGLAAQAGDVPTNAPAQLQLDGRTPQICVPDAGPAPAKLDLLLQVPDFAAAWHHQLGARASTWSLSEYDMSIAAIAAQAQGITDQDLAELIAHHRRLHGSDKAARLDYLQRTIAKVRAPRPQQQAADQLDMLRRLAA